MRFFAGGLETELQAFLREQPGLEEVSSEDVSVWTLFRDETKRLCARHVDLPKLKPLCVDFLSTESQAKVRSLRAHKQPLLRAMGGDLNASIVDLTAGLGSDAFLLASSGFQVTAFEKNPIIYALLEDGVKRFLQENSEMILRINFGEATECARDFDPDIVYLDPMFPEKKKGRLSKGPMQYIQQLSSEPREKELQILFQFAKQMASKRVVVKRPLKSVGMFAEPTHSYKGTSIRYDTYSVMS